VTITLQAEFEDVFAVRGLFTEQHGKLNHPAWQNGALFFSYDGADGLFRSLTASFSPDPEWYHETSAEFSLMLQPGESTDIRVTLAISESAARRAATRNIRRNQELEDIRSGLQRSANSWIEHGTQVRSDSLLLARIIERSLRDLNLLRTDLGSGEFFAAGVPWFATLFGRDSIITALQTLAFDPDIAKGTLRLLAKYQGTKVDDWRDEQPGKIMHELRIGEMAHLDEIPQTPYYGTIDATPLFLILVAQHAAWTGDLSLFHELRGPIEQALDWIDRYGDQNGDGYVEYASTSEKGLVNQGWKDSGDAIVNADGSLAQPPISLVEVQGYVYMAKIGLAGLYERAGAPETAMRLRQEAQDLQDRFNRDFWLEEQGIFALALQAEGRPAAVVSSNPGQALWTGIVDAEKARRTVQRLMAQDIFNGWGIRTLSDQARRYNPVGYHLGTVWPHDNSIIAAGFRRYGFEAEALRIFQGIAEAAMSYDHFRLPELFAGFARNMYGTPARYPVACHPQAWAAGSIPFLLTTALGLVPEAFEQRLRIVRPVLPPFVDWVELRGLRVGRSTADLRFERRADGRVAANVLAVHGRLDVVSATEPPNA
jgi:glycogen debranching enzyme